MYNVKENGLELIRSTPPCQTYVVETITMTVTERRIVHEASDNKAETEKSDVNATSANYERNETIDGEPKGQDQLGSKQGSLNQSINGILKGGKLWKEQGGQVGLNELRSSLVIIFKTAFIIIIITV